MEVSGKLDYSLPATRLDLLQKFLTYLEKVAPKDESERSEDQTLDNQKEFSALKGLIQDWGISQTSKF